MATKLYTIENLLIGKTYRSNSRHFSGEIISAEPRQFGMAKILKRI